MSNTTPHCIVSSISAAETFISSDVRVLIQFLMDTVKFYCRAIKAVSFIPPLSCINYLLINYDHHITHGGHLTQGSALCAARG